MENGPNRIEIEFTGRVSAEEAQSQTSVWIKT